MISNQILYPKENLNLDPGVKYKEKGPKWTRDIDSPVAVIGLIGNSETIKTQLRQSLLQQGQIEVRNFVDVDQWDLILGQIRKEWKNLKRFGSFKNVALI